MFVIMFVYRRTSFITTKIFQNYNKQEAPSKGK